MQFALSDDQRMLQDTLRGFVADKVPLDAVRKATDGDSAVAEAIGAGLAELGLPALLVPEGHGGLGLGLVEAAVAQEALGGAVSPAGFTGSALAAIGIAAAGNEAQQTELLPAIASGAARYAIALAERTGVRDGTGVSSKDGTLNGTALFALDADRATHLLIATSDGALHFLPVDGDGVEAIALTTIDGTRPATEFAFANAPATPLSGENQPGAAADRIVAAARLLIAADTLGASQHMLEAAVDYAGQREQFGRVIASFQAVKHLCAEMAAKIECARALVWHAAYAFNSGDAEAPVMACLAKAHLAEVGTFVARTATEVHGGMGFTDLLGLHFWFKRIGANRQLMGGPERVRAEAAKMQGWAA
ncbi:MAG: acyl-CoA/acyl-ACP dehydrogenase [Sphingomonadaceae bacterium]|nr:acyl-CoA/acyl-ACP dehydrogenase [Sphingomonadaceae bacterium]